MWLNSRRPMTPKQARFVEFYLRTLNATRSARLAGYSAKTANEAGARLLRHPRVRAELRWRSAAMIEAGTDRAAQLLEDAHALGGEARRLRLMQALTAIGRLAKLTGLGNYGHPRCVGRPRF